MTGPRPKRVIWDLFHSPTFEEGFWKAYATNPSLEEIVCDIEYELRVDPHGCGEVHAERGSNFHIWASPDVARLPKVRIYFEIDAEITTVILWSIALR